MLTGKDFAEFEKHYPQAANFLRERKLRNELALLRNNEPMLNGWQRHRLSELSQLFGKEEGRG